MFVHIKISALNKYVHFPRRHNCACLSQNNITISSTICFLIIRSILLYQLLYVTGKLHVASYFYFYTSLSRWLPHSNKLLTKSTIYIFLPESSSPFVTVCCCSVHFKSGLFFLKIDAILYFQYINRTWLAMRECHSWPKISIKTQVFFIHTRAQKLRVLHEHTYVHQRKF